jgi:hypothetical protein
VGCEAVAHSITGESPGISPTIGPPTAEQRATSRVCYAGFLSGWLKPSFRGAAAAEQLALGGVRDLQHGFGGALVSVSVGRGGGNMQLPDRRDPVARQEPDGKAFGECRTVHGGALQQVAPLNLAD